MSDAWKALLDDLKEAAVNDDWGQPSESFESILARHRPAIEAEVRATPALVVRHAKRPFREVSKEDAEDFGIEEGPDVHIV